MVEVVRERRATGRSGSPLEEIQEKYGLVPRRYKVIIETALPEKEIYRRLRATSFRVVRVAFVPPAALAMGLDIAIIDSPPDKG